VAAVTASFATVLGVAGPAHAGLGDGGPGGPTRFDVTSGYTCNWVTGQITITESISQDPAYSGWQHVQSWYAVPPPGTPWDVLNTSGFTLVADGWLAPGSAPITASFTIYPPPAGQFLETDEFDVSPNDGWGIGQGWNLPASCQLTIIHYPIFKFS
jgi:hypothetical protein